MYAHAKTELADEEGRLGAMQLLIAGAIAGAGAHHHRKNTRGPVTGKTEGNAQTASVTHQWSEAIHLKCSASSDFFLYCS